MKVAIIEDEPLAADRLIALLKEYDAETEILTVLESVEQGVKWFSESQAPDLVLSDIQIADGLSFEIFREVEVKCPVIFTTAFDQYAIEAFEVNSIDYLLKPIKFSKLENSLNKWKQLSQQFSSSLDVDSLVSAIKEAQGGYKSRFLVKTGQQIRPIKAEDIAYFYAKDKIVLLVTHKGDKYAVDYTLDDLNALLDPAFFFRINRQFIIHLEAAREIHSYFKGRLKLVLSPEVDEEVIVSSDRTPVFKAWLDQ